MDIYKLAKEFQYQYADYMDMTSMLIFKTRDYNNQLKAGNTDAKIAVHYTDGTLLGYAEKDGTLSPYAKK